MDTSKQPRYKGLEGNAFQVKGGVEAKALKYKGAGVLREQRELMWQSTGTERSW